MKQLFFLLFIFPFGPGLQAQNTYAEKVRDYVRENLIFYYIDDPSSPPPRDMGTIEVDKNTIAAGNNINSPLWTNSANLGLRQLLVKLLASVDKGGDFKLQRIARDALLITNKKVIVYLYNDSANAVPHVAWSIYSTYGGSNPAENNKCWPSAGYFINRKLGAGGHMALGAHFFNPASNLTSEDANDKTATFLHELVHTQLKNVIERSVPQANWYGKAGEGHFFSEILPSKNTAFNEGVATAFAFRYHLPISQNSISWFNNNRMVWVDSIPGCAVGTTPAYHCIMSRLQAAGLTGTASTANGIPGRRYPIRDVPPELLVHNETVLANLIYEYTRQYRSPLMLVRDIKRAHTDIGTSKGNKSTFLALYKQMLKSSKDWKPTIVTKADQPRGEVFTTGITDFYLGYNLNDRATLERSLGFSWSADFPNIDEYFNSQRAVLQGLRRNNTTWDQQQLDEFGALLNIHSPRSVATSGRANSNK